MNISIMEQLFTDATTKQGLSKVKEFAQLNPGLKISEIRNSDKQTLLHVAAGYGKINLVSYLIKEGANVNALDASGLAPLHNACCHCHYQCTEKLINAGADVNLVDNKKWPPLLWALERRCNRQKVTLEYWKVITLLLDRGANPYLRVKGRTCLDRIADDEDKRIVKLKFLENQLERSEPSEKESLIDKYLEVEDFFEFVRDGDCSLKHFFTQNLTSSRLQSSDNITPLHRAAGYNHVDLARLLIQEGALVDAGDNFGRIPLHNAAQHGHIEMIELLVSNGTNVNKQDTSGYTPLHLAATSQTAAVCLKLIQLGASVRTKCHLGKFPFELAESADVKELLKIDEMIPSTSTQAICIRAPSVTDQLMLNSDQSAPLTTNQMITMELLNETDFRYRLIRERMTKTIMAHDNGTYFTRYDIISIKRILNEKIWSKYKIMCQYLELEHGPGTKNEQLLFHGSKFVDDIQKNGFDDKFAQKNGMFGAGIYFAEHSSKSNQYTFDFDKGCQTHMDKSCYVCERKMIYAQVALGRSLVAKTAMPDLIRAPHGHSSVTGSPGTTVGLTYPEYSVYLGGQAYPLFVIEYRIKP